MTFILDGKTISFNHYQKLFEHDKVWDLIHDDYFYSIYLKCPSSNYGYRVKEHGRLQKSVMKSLVFKINIFYKIDIDKVSQIVIDTSRKDLVIYL